MGILDFIFNKKPLKYAKFRDSLGNFSIDYPEEWKFDKDIAVVDGQYTNSFHWKDCSFTVSVDARIPEGFHFWRYAKAEFESPSAGIYAKAVKSEFRGMPAYTREYVYRSGNRDYFGGGVVFFTGRLVLVINWTAPQSKKCGMDIIFGHMLDSLVTGKEIKAGS